MAPFTSRPAARNCRRPHRLPLCACISRPPRLSPTRSISATMPSRPRSTPPRSILATPGGPRPRRCCTPSPWASLARALWGIRTPSLSTPSCARWLPKRRCAAACSPTRSSSVARRQPTCPTRTPALSWPARRARCCAAMPTSGASRRKVVVMQNHGLIALGGSAQEVDSITDMFRQDLPRPGRHLRLWRPALCRRATCRPHPHPPRRGLSSARAQAQLGCWGAASRGEG
jgi:hypothetical protein